MANGPLKPRVSYVPGALSTASFVVVRKTLVAAGHVTTQNLGGKKMCCAGGVAEYFDCCCGKLGGFQLSALSGFEVKFYR